MQTEVIILIVMSAVYSATIVLFFWMLYNTQKAKEQAVDYTQKLHIELAKVYEQLEGQKNAYSKLSEMYNAQGKNSKFRQQISLTVDADKAIENLDQISKFIRHMDYHLSVQTEPFFASQLINVDNLKPFDVVRKKPNGRIDLMVITIEDLDRYKTIEAIWDGRFGKNHPVPDTEYTKTVDRIYDRFTNTGEKPVMKSFPKDTEILKHQIEMLKYEMQSLHKLPSDLETETWFSENIDEGCSASSAIYKFRLWLHDRKINEALEPPVEQTRPLV